MKRTLANKENTPSNWLHSENNHDVVLAGLSRFLYIYP
jgi:hypothetical protein